MVRNTSTLWFFASIVLASIMAALALEWFFQLTAGDKTFYFIDHYLFGIAGPFFFALPFSTGGRSFPKPKFLPQVSMFLHRYGFQKIAGQGFWGGVVTCAVWSIGNEILIYWIRNPKHGADWGHWASDIAGMLTAYLFYRRLLVRESQQVRMNLA